MADAQDIVTLRDGTDILARVIEVGTAEVRLRDYDSTDTTVYSLAKGEILMIRFENGSKQIFEHESQALAASDNMYLKGKNDAALHYRGSTGAGAGTLATAAVLGPLWGLVPAAACGSSAPKDKNLNCRDTTLLRNLEYRSGYVDQARMTKKKKVWKNYWIGTGISFAILIAIASSN
jgi:hypothetical protein